MKLEITPASLKQHAAENNPPTITMSKVNIAFSYSATKLLSLKNDDRFTLEFEDGSVYYKESDTGFKVYESGKAKVMVASAPGIGNYFNKLFKTDKPSHKFLISELKLGRRLLSITK